MITDHLLSVLYVLVDQNFFISILCTGHDNSNLHFILQTIQLVKLEQQLQNSTSIMKPIRFYLLTLIFQVIGRVVVSYNSTSRL